MRESEEMKKFRTEIFGSFQTWTHQEFAVNQAILQLVRLHCRISGTEIILHAFLQQMQEYITGRTGGTPTDEPKIVPPCSHGLLRYAVEGAIHHLDKINDGELAKPEDFAGFGYAMRKYVEIRLIEVEKQSQHFWKMMGRHEI